jgi:hypothetical protein
VYLKCVEKYNHARCRWITMTPMHEARASFGCAALDEFIYVMGGYDGTFYLKSVERLVQLSCLRLFCVVSEFYNYVSSQKRIF